MPPALTLLSKINYLLVLFGIISGKSGSGTLSPPRRRLGHFPYYDGAEKNKKDGLTFEQVSVGKFKDSGSPDKPLTSEERAIFLRDGNIIHANFIEAVAKNRGLPIEEVKRIADGSTVLGAMAQSLGLIDEIGGEYEAEEYLEEIIGEKPEVCWG